MDIPFELSFRNMDHSDAVAARVQERAAKLGARFDRMTSCRVTVEAPHRRHRKGKLYRVSLEIDLPNRQLLVNRHSDEHHAHEDVYVAIRDAFNAAQRQLEDHARKTAGKVKSHETPLHGRVVALDGLHGHGIIALPDGQRIYFHRNSVVNDGFGRLDLENEVRLVVAEGESAKGPQATTVTPIGKHHLNIC